MFERYLPYVWRAPAAYLRDTRSVFKGSPQRVPRAHVPSDARNRFRFAASFQSICRVFLGCEEASGEPSVEFQEDPWRKLRRIWNPEIVPQEVRGAGSREYEERVRV